MLRRSLIFAIIALLLFVLPLSVSSSLRDGVSSATAPLTGFLTSQRVAATNFFRNIGQLGELRTERAELQGEIASLQQQLSELEAIKRENEALRLELGVTGVSRELPKLAAQVIFQGTDPLDRSFTINTGAQAGVTVGQPAVANGYLVGRVISVRAHTAVVRSILSPRSIIQAWLPGSGEKGLLAGNGNTARFEKVPQGTEVVAGSLLETSGLGETLPQGILIGTIGSRVSEASDVSQTFRIDLPVDPGAVTNVFILLTDDPASS